MKPVRLTFLAAGSFLSAVYLTGAVFSIWLLKTGDGMPWAPDGFVLPLASRFVAGPVAAVFFLVVPKIDGNRGFSLFRCFLVSIGMGSIVGVGAFLLFPY